MPKRVDKNQPEIVAALRQAGCSVVHLHEVGQGCPDVLVGRNDINYLIEIKDGQKSPSKRKLTPIEAEFHAAWRGQVCIAKTVDDALRVVGLVI